MLVQKKSTRDAAYRWW